MKNDNTSLESWEQVIRKFLQEKQESEEEVYIKNEIKRVQPLYHETEYFGEEEIVNIFDSKKYKKDKQETALAFQQRRAKNLLLKTPESLNRFQLLKKYVTFQKQIHRKYNPVNWLSKNCANASSVSFATHVIKLTHSKIDSPSIFDEIHEIKDGFVTTSSLKHKAIDGAVAGNQFAPIFQFLELQLNGMKLAEKLTKDNDLLVPFLPPDDEVKEDLLNKWIAGFKQSLNSGNPATHSLAKQTYFPIKGTDKKYHLLCNVVSSSMAHAIYNKVFDDAQKPIKMAYEKQKYNSEILTIYPKRSHLNVTASNHSNASQLNGKRGGKLHLFSAQPPIWQSQLKPPVNRRSLFDDLYNDTIRTEMDYLRDFLLRFKQLDLSIKDPKRFRHLERWVNNIIDEFLFYVGTIQNLPSGWSEQSPIRLKKAHQYLLDPYREDESFQTALQSMDWQKVIRDDFAAWMNRRLRGKDNQFTLKAEHTRLWKKLLEQPLREHAEQIKLETSYEKGDQL